MPTLKWDRLLETCCRRDADVALLVPGSPPLIRVGKYWRSLDVPPLLPQDVVAMAAERLRPKPEGEVAGYAYSEFWYGDEEFFCAMAFGFPETRLLVVSRSPRPPGTTL